MGQSLVCCADDDPQGNKAADLVSGERLQYFQCGTGNKGHLIFIHGSNGSSN